MIVFVIAMLAMMVGAVVAAFRRISRLHSQRRVLESVVILLLSGYDPDLELNAWVKVLWYPSGDPPEREGQPITLAEREVVERLRPESGT